VEDYPDSELKWSALLSLGLAAYKAEKYPEAAVALRRVWESPDAAPVHHTAFDALVTVYKDSRFWDAAVSLSREYLKRLPDSPDEVDRRMDIGWFFLQMGQWDDAIHQYRSLLPLPDAEREAEAQYYIGESYMAKGEYRTAILEFLRVKILGRKTKLDWGVTALYQAGICYEKLGESEGAARMYRRIVDETGAASNYGRTAQKRLDDLAKP
jgi:tetratricopeptide (TPR) repeat protein